MGIHLRRRWRSIIIGIVIAIVVPHRVCCGPSDESQRQVWVTYCFQFEAVPVRTNVTLNIVRTVERPIT